MPDPRFHLDAALKEGARARLDPADTRHAGAALRLGVGASVRVFNARDGEWRAEIDAKDKHGVAVMVKALLRPARPAPDIDLLFAPVKRDATDLIVEKATELGARRVIPVITARTIAQTVRTDRLRAIARGAAAQTERFDIPEILAPRPLAKALDAWPPDRILIYADEAGDDAGAPWGGETGRAPPILEALIPLPLVGTGQGGRGEQGRAPASHSGRTPPATSPPQAGRGLSVLIGPEGGFDTGERRMLRALPFVIPVSLGPRLLRAETAAIAALALVQAILGDWALAAPLASRQIPD